MRRRLALLASAALVALAVPFAPAVADDDADAGGDATTTAREVTEATLRWGLSNEANNGAFAPGSYNFMSAGRIGNPGEGGQTIRSADAWSNGKPAGWEPSVGNVSLEKKTTSGTYAPASWAGLKTSPSGAPTSPPTSTNFSDHQIVFSHGTGWADPDTGRASISWRGDFTVVSYSGMTFFYVSNPRLLVDRDGSGILRGTVSGWGSALNDQTVWQQVPATEVTLATLPKVTVEADEDGTGETTVTPAYDGVKVDTEALGLTPQVRSGSSWGSWPASFIAGLARTGSGEYWYSTGGAVDAHKKALPIDFLWTLGDTLAEDPEDPQKPVDPDPTPGTPDPPKDNGGNNGGDKGNGNGNGDKTNKKFTVSNAQFQWGMTNEMNNSAFAPGTVNHFSAGRIADPGGSGYRISPKEWKARAGNVRIEKATKNGGSALATWEGLRTTPEGTSINSVTNSFSDHTVVMSGGKGTVNPKKGTATIRWKGSYTALLYSGLSLFIVSDPVLTVSNGTVRVDATLSGYASSREDTSLWKPLPATKVRLVNAPAKSLKSKRGFTVTPKYAGVRYDAPAGGVAQVRTGSGWGSFPPSFVDFQQDVGTASFWYTSGGATDRLKSALPIAFSYNADKPVKAPKADDRGDNGDDSTTPPSTTLPPGTTTPPMVTPSGTPLSNTAPVTAPSPATVVGLGPAATPVGTTEGLRPVAQPLGGAPSWPWWAGGAMALAALLVTVTSRLLVRRVGT